MTIQANAVGRSLPPEAAPPEEFSPLPTPAGPSQQIVYLAQGNPTQLYRSTAIRDGEAQFEPVGPAAAMQYNAIAYNPADGFIYGVTLSSGGGVPAGSLIQVGADGAVSRIGSNTFGFLSYGSFGPDGLFYATTRDRVAMWAIDVTAGEAVRRISLTAPIQRGEDWTFSSGYLWTMSESKYQRINPLTGELTTFSHNLDLGATDIGAGAAWTLTNGDLAFLHNQTGQIFQVRVASPSARTPTFTVVSVTAGPRSGNNDGTATSAG